MSVHGGGISRAEVDAHLDHLASGSAQIVPLQVGSFALGLLSTRQVQRQNTPLTSKELASTFG